MPEKRRFETKCTECGKPTTVPFKPTPGKPIYCKICFSKRMPARHVSTGATVTVNSKQAWARRR